MTIAVDKDVKQQNKQKLVNFDLDKYYTGRLFIKLRIPKPSEKIKIDL